MTEGVEIQVRNDLANGFQISYPNGRINYFPDDGVINSTELDAIRFAGSLGVGGNTIANFGGIGFGGDTAVSFPVVPEPSSWLPMIPTFISLRQTRAAASATEKITPA